MAASKMEEDRAGGEFPLRSGERRSAPVVGVTGGIGVGKSAVAEVLGRGGAHVISADDIGHEVLREDREVQRALAEAFGGEVIGPEGQPLRKVIGERVFGNHDALARLNRIVHPPLLERLRSRIDAARHDPAVRLIVVDAALITEWGIEDWFDLLIVVTAPEDQVRARLRTKGLTDEQINRRIASQLPEAARRREPDIVVRNDGDRRKLEGLVGHVMRELVERG